ncbi:MAG: LysM peptidoglycan-binding domain-containing protein [Bacteroidota bacterium]
MLKEKYSDLMNLAAQLKMQGLEANEEAGKLKIKGTATYQSDKDLFWDKIKGYSNWENEVGANIQVERTDIYGMYTVQSGDTLSKLAKGHLGDPMKYMEIFNLNKDILTNPDLIKVGQVLKLPNK